jgi:hypothetical protein
MTVAQIIFVSSAFIILLAVSYSLGAKHERQQICNYLTYLKIRASVGRTEAHTFWAIEHLHTLRRDIQNQVHRERLNVHGH